MGQQHLTQQKWWQGGHVIGMFALFAIVDSSRMITADPLTPPMQPELLAGLMSWQIGIANEPQMRLEASHGQRLRQASDTARNATGACIGVRPFKGEDMKLHLCLAR